MSTLLPYLAAVLCLGVPSLMLGLTLWDEYQFRKFQKKCNRKV